jgi:hypothetical protein
MDDPDDDFNLDVARRRGFDNPGVSRHRRQPHPNWLAIAVAVISIIVQVGTFFWYGGRLTQRVDTLEAVLVEQRQRDVSLAEDNGRQNVTLGIIGQQYGDISRRLGSIESKLDQR